MALVELETVDSLKDLVGREIGVTDWLSITQERIQKFAETTDDMQWIHTDPERAKRESPYGATIAQRFFDALSDQPIHEADASIPRRAQNDDQLRAEPGAIPRRRPLEFKNPGADHPAVDQGPLGWNRSYLLRCCRGAAR